MIKKCSKCERWFEVPVWEVYYRQTHKKAEGKLKPRDVNGNWSCKFCSKDDDVKYKITEYIGDEHDKD